VIGGNYNVLALDIFKQVIGQQNFNKGAVVSLILLAPVFVAFIVDWIMQGRLQSQFSARAVPYAPRPKRWFDTTMLVFCVVVALLLLAVLGMGDLHVVHQAVAVRLELLAAPLHVRADRRRRDLLVLEQRQDGGAHRACSGRCSSSGARTCWKKTAGMRGLRALIRLLAAIPMGVPGMVLGLGYILFFNHPDIR